MKKIFEIHTTWSDVAYEAVLEQDELAIEYTYRVYIFQESNFEDMNRNL